MRPCHVIAMALFAGALAAPVRAEEPPLTLDAVLAELARRSPELRLRNAEVRAAAERPAQARAFEDPVFMTELWQVPVNAQIVPLMFTLRQPIPWPGKLRARARALEPEAALYRASAHDAHRGLRLQAARTYYEYRLAHQAAEVLRQTRQLLSTIEALVDTRYRVGRAELAELLKAKEEIASLDTALLDQERQRDIAATTINTLLDQPPARPLGVPASVVEVLPLPPAEELTERALRTRPDVLAALAALDQARARVGAAQAERAPDLMLWGSYMVMLRDRAAGPPDTFTAGAQVSLPSFSLARSGAAAREAQALTAARQAALDQVRAKVRGEVREALLRLDTARRHIQLHRETMVPLSEQAVQAAQASYQSGRGSLVLLLDAARALLAHRLEYEQFQTEYGQRLAELEAATGGPPGPALGDRR